jgi:hypothetical protein
MSDRLFVAGRFDDAGGRPSRIAATIHGALDIGDVELQNGGNFSRLEDIVHNIRGYRLVFWMADVPNGKKKVIMDVKRNNPACILVTSKRNTEGTYDFPSLLHHALGRKSNLVVEFTERDARKYGRVFDPLGNVFLNHTDDFRAVGRVLGARAVELLDYTRMRSEQVGPVIPCPDQPEFFDRIREYADVFHSLIHPAEEAGTRFLGNASFRCERGFPSFKQEGLLFVSQRNVDKRSIDQSSFVAVDSWSEGKVRYFGAQSPSVDTPVQLRLYRHFTNARFMLHSHTYVLDAPFTHRLIPCGAVEEAAEIIRLYPDRESIDFPVNIRGHGSLVVAHDVRALQNIPYLPRPMPELQLDYVLTLAR